MEKNVINISLSRENLAILITDPVDEYMIKALRSKGIKVNYRPDIEREELLKTIEDYNVLVVRSRTKVDKEIIERGKSLRVIARAGIGVDNIDVDEAERRNIKVVYAPGASTESAAELTIGLMIAGARNMFTSMSLAKSGIYKKTEGVELHGKTIGIIGFGRIGYKVGLIAKAMGMNVIAYDVVDVSAKAAEIGGKAVTLDELVSASDVISIHVTVGKDAKPILTAREFEKMKNGVIIVNTSRAVAVDGKALLKYIKEGKVRSYATDVFWHEPPKEEWEVELLRHERVTVTAHIGAQTKEAQYRVAVMTTENLLKTLQDLGVKL
ncbi:3-phosphoglycerate dehydrogenase [Metallosphaera tengchongensis]|uniref:3-phosphoglycerate dehydrogenase n=1 Tax=Metallosphaera tengchongensis TaxID=1532350 RepID=A0A6N0NRE9_9CREN|nr:NAD(P)-dependent oxidoreductase [Metallosphaera tengchongensis]QKQ99325.1 3-phosphoglycerate dehydrogenase [Metallosphaera tengchongensis]